MLNYKKGNCLQVSTTSRTIIHIVNNKGAFGLGFALAVAKKYPKIKEKYLRWYGDSLLYGNVKFQLGMIQPVWINENLKFINMLAQDGLIGFNNPQPLDYIALELCLKKVKKITPIYSEIWMPDMIGCGLAGGNREKVIELIEKTLIDLKITVFEL